MHVRAPEISVGVVRFEAAAAEFMWLCEEVSRITAEREHAREREFVELGVIDLGGEA